MGHINRMTKRFSINRKRVFSGFALLILAIGLFLFVHPVSAFVSMDYSHCARRGCTKYKLTILGNGRVVFEGEEGTFKEGRHVVRISQEQAQALFDEIESADVFRLERNYLRSLSSDGPFISLYVWQNGRFKDIDHLAGDISAPPNLIAIENIIESTVSDYKLIREKSGTYAGEIKLQIASEKAQCGTSYYGECYQMRVNEDIQWSLIPVEHVDGFDWQEGVEYEAVFALSRITFNPIWTSYTAYDFVEIVDSASTQ